MHIDILKCWVQAGEVAIHISHAQMHVRRHVDVCVYECDRSIQNAHRGDGYLAVVELCVLSVLRQP